ncbi:Retrovirus-related Pol polyprotein from transposon 17.6 [Eumeta japonica]|uniref:Retrovirus-related Pol polyprotein from transposon 17.6 n=1 Tax=Eumeta variegata TaxID=151549 RepID=A0A4C1WKQ9_EUMVA|nr:Retrovirus-related Pol polyprotein from transposon 17.6 [Eumeta japonica]
MRTNVCEPYNTRRTPESDDESGDDKYNVLFGLDILRQAGMEIRGNQLKLGNNTIELNYNSEDIEIDLENLFQQYNKIFTVDVTDSVTSKVKHEIKLTDDSPVYQRPFRLPQTQRKEVRKQLKKLLKENVIRPSDSPWASQYIYTFTLTTDASDKALGAVLSQNQHPIAYASRTLSETERRYNTTEKLLAVLWACQHFRHIYGRKFNLETDHQPLTWLSKLKEPNAKLTRWRLRLQEYDYDIKHTKGRENKPTPCRIELPQRLCTQIMTMTKQAYQS